MIASLGVPAGTPAPSADAHTSATLILPLTAVVRSPHDPRGFAVFVIAGGGSPERGGGGAAPGESKETVKLVDVKLGDVIGSGVYVTDGVAATDRVVTMGATLVRDGDAVRIIP
jgi:multidrug efflux system membrane fusion protein